MWQGRANLGMWHVAGPSMSGRPLIMPAKHWRVSGSTECCVGSGGGGAGAWICNRAGFLDAVEAGVTWCLWPTSMSGRPLMVPAKDWRVNESAGGGRLKVKHYTVCGLCSCQG
jgi:hypothetical protein